MKYLLDTNAVSSVMRGERSHVDRLEALAPGEVALAQPVLAELLYGLARLPPSRRRERLRRSLDLIVETLPQVAWTNAVSEEFGRIKASLEARGTRIEDFDCAIAAHATANGLTLVTASRAHMTRVTGLAVEDWSS